MRRLAWAATVALSVALLSAACSPTAAPVPPEAGTPAADQDSTPVAWQLEPTRIPQPTAPPGPTPSLSQLSPDAQTAVAIATATGARPYKDSTGAWATEPPGTVPPTVAVPRAPLPTPTPEPALQCQFGDDVVTLQPTPLPIQDPTPGSVPTWFQPVPGEPAVAAGEVFPGVSLTWRVARTTVLAGALIRPHVEVHNTSAATVRVEAGVAAVLDGQSEASSWAQAQADARSLPPFRADGFGPFGGPEVPSGQTWSIPSALVQVPFDAAAPVHLHARVGVTTLPAVPDGRALTPTWVTADVPLHLLAPTPAQELTLDFRADHEQWCLRATTGTGRAPSEPLVVRLLARSPLHWYAELGPHAGSAGTWAGRWHLDGITLINGVVAHRDRDDAFTTTAWVGGPTYVTATTSPLFVAAP